MAKIEGESIIYGRRKELMYLTMSLYSVNYRNIIPPFSLTYIHIGIQPKWNSKTFIAGTKFWEKSSTDH